MRQAAKLFFIIIIVTLFVLGCTQKQESIEGKQADQEKAMDKSNEFNDELDQALEDLETAEEG